MCDLCTLNKETIWYKERSGYAIIQCRTCRVPMLVLKLHKIDINKQEEKLLEGALTELGDEYCSRDRYYIDKNQRTITDHLHWHLREITK